MSDLISLVNSLRRPRLLLQAARNGLGDYNGSRALKRLLPAQASTTPAAKLNALITVEDDLEQARRAGDASYSASKHVEVFIALLAEARNLARGPRPA